MFYIIIIMDGKEGERVSPNELFIGILLIVTYCFCFLLFRFFCSFFFCGGGGKGVKKNNLEPSRIIRLRYVFLVEGFEKRIQLMCAAVAQADEEAAFDRVDVFSLFLFSRLIS